MNERYFAKLYAIIVLYTFFIVGITSLCWWAYLCKKERITERFTEKVEISVKDTVNWEALTDAIIWVESRGDNNAINKTTQALGCFQQMPIFVRDANRIIGYDKYKLSDRTNKDKSTEIFNVVQKHYNPERDLHKAIKIQHPKAKLSYHNAVVAKYKELLNE